MKEGTSSFTSVYSYLYLAKVSEYYTYLLHSRNVQWIDAEEHILTLCVFAGERLCQFPFKRISTELVVAGFLRWIRALTSTITDYFYVHQV
jgi:hypothetical protein